MDEWKDIVKKVMRGRKTHLERAVKYRARTGCSLFSALQHIYLMDEVRKSKEKEKL